MEAEEYYMRLLWTARRRWVFAFDSSDLL